MTAASFFLSGLFASVLGAIPVPPLLAAGGVIVASGVLPLRSAHIDRERLVGQPGVSQISR